MTINNEDISTGSLLNALKKSKDIHSFIENNLSAFIEVSLPDYLKILLASKRLVKSEVIARSGLTEIYTYQIFAGTKKPKRKKVLAIALAMYLSPEECDMLLKHARCAELYARVKWDAILIFALKEELGVIATNEILYEYGLELIE